MGPMLDGVRWPLISCLSGSFLLVAAVAAALAAVAVVGRMPRIFGRVLWLLGGCLYRGGWRFWIGERLQMDIGDCFHRGGRGPLFRSGLLAWFL